MNNGAGSVGGKQAAQQFLIADVAGNELVSGKIPDRLQISEISGVGQLIEIDDRGVFCFQPSVNEVGPDESSAPGHDDCIIHKMHKCKRVASLFYTQPSTGFRFRG